MIVADEQAGPIAAALARVRGRHRLRWALVALALGAAIALAGGASRQPALGETTAAGEPSGSAGMVGDVAGVVIMSADAGCGPREVKVVAPGPLPITFHNHGTSERTLTIEGVAGALAAAPRGGEASGTFTLERPGAYTFWCATAEQGRAGLQERYVRGTLIVGDGAAGRP